MRRMVPHLLWIDSSAGLTVGVFVLTFSSWLRGFFGLPWTLLIGMGVANLAYGLFSFSLARRKTRPMALLSLLAIANGLWAILCMVMAIVFAPVATGFGLAHLSLESLFVGGLAALEWHNRRALVTRPLSPS